MQKTDYCGTLEAFLYVIVYFINIVLLFLLFFFFFFAHSYDEATSTMDTGYPRSIEDDFPGMDDEIDAAAYHYGIVKPKIAHFQCF